VTVIPGEDQAVVPDDGALRPYSSLDQALEAHRIPPENRELIRTFTAAVGIDRYLGCSGYIKAVRRGEGPALNITSGWTNGFVSEAEATECAGSRVERWESTRGTGLWGVSHPLNSMRGGSRTLKHEERDYGYCPTCFLQLLPSGVCGSCGT
jgi:hypothetical protein